MKEIVVISGKGGTGKTSITASFSYLGGDSVVVADCDVDAADMHLLLKPEVIKPEDFYSGLIANINQDVCISCGLCAQICRFEAIHVDRMEYTVEKLQCEGCAYCSKVCPTEAILMIEQKVGEWFISKTNHGNILVHARLGIGAENSGKLVAKVKNEAKRIAVMTNKDFVLVDGSPGIGCPVVSSLSGANFVVLVTEATVSGLHDLKRVVELVKKFNIKAGCIINKFDLNREKSNEIIEFLNSEKIFHIASLPYDDAFTKAMTIGKTIVEYDNNELSSILKESWNKIKKIVEE